MSTLCIKIKRQTVYNIYIYTYIYIYIYTYIQCSLTLTSVDPLTSKQQVIKPNHQSHTLSIQQMPNWHIKFVTSYIALIFRRH